MNSSQRVSQSCPLSWFALQ